MSENENNAPIVGMNQQFIAWVIKNWRTLFTLAGALWIGFGEYQSYKDNQKNIEEVNQDYGKFKKKITSDVRSVSDTVNLAVTQLKDINEYVNIMAKYRDKFDMADSVAQIYMFDVDMLYSVALNMMEDTALNGHKFLVANSGQFYYKNNGTLYLVRHDNVRDEYFYLNEKHETIIIQ